MKNLIEIAMSTFMFSLSILFITVCFLLYKEIKKR